MCLALIVAGLDTLIITMALPSIQDQLSATPGELQWMVDAYSLAFAAPILFAGGLVDRFGRRLGFISGMVVFLIASIAAVLAGSAATLIAARVGMGLGAALIMPSTLSLIRHIFPPEERAKAMGIWVGAASLGVPLGPVIGGVLLENFWWGSVFLINLPLIGAALIGCLLLIPESRNEDHPGLDTVGLVLSVAGLLAAVDGIIEAPAHGWTSARTLILVIGGVAVLAGFIVWERRARNPMLSDAVFRDRRFGGPLVTISTLSFGLFGALFLVTLYLQFALGYEPLKAGAHMLALCTMMFAAPLATKLVERFGLGPVSMFGLVLMVVSLLVLAAGDAPSSGRVLLALGVMGIGVGFGTAPSTNSVLEATPAHQSGAGSAVADVAFQLGGALGIAVMGSVVTTSYRNGVTVPDGLSPSLHEAAASSIGGAAAAARFLGDGGARLLASATDAFLDGVRSATIIGAVVAAVGAVLAAIVLPRGRVESPASEAEELRGDLVA
ncbi:DHA2 family efflux MFS transporter permease subunit [Nocardia pseudovaccinii]|uniref:DHA2 family efflux MFS transporter permease subunit n=1 Tax=Nocardia pseudovaccinii TaxID=189540 RepID=UPI003D90ED81